jgi:hypothetical protein
MKSTAETEIRATIGIIASNKFDLFPAKTIFAFIDKIKDA